MRKVTLSLMYLALMSTASEMNAATAIDLPLAPVAVAAAAAAAGVIPEQYTYRYNGDVNGLATIPTGTTDLILEIPTTSSNFQYCHGFEDFLAIEGSRLAHLTHLTVRLVGCADKDQSLHAFNTSLSQLIKALARQYCTNIQKFDFDVRVFTFHADAHPMAETADLLHGLKIYNATGGTSHPQVHIQMSRTPDRVQDDQTWAKVIVDYLYGQYGGPLKRRQIDIEVNSHHYN